MIGWMHLGELNCANLKDAVHPELAKVLLRRGLSGVGASNSNVRQFLMNLACSDPDNLEYQKEMSPKKTIHIACDAAVCPLGKQHGKVASLEHGKVASLDNFGEVPADGEPATESTVPPSNDSNGPSVEEMADAACNSLEPKDFMLTSQDEGKQKPRSMRKKQMLATVWPKLDSQSLIMRKAITKLGQCQWLPQNSTTIKGYITTELNLKRTRKLVKCVHKLQSTPILEAKPSAKEMYVLLAEQADPCSGLKTILGNLFYSLRERHFRAQTANRVPNDAIRVVAIMLDPKHRNGCMEWAFRVSHNSV